MRIIVSLASLLGCTAAKPSATRGAAEWPGKTVVVECVNEPGMEASVF